jgi:hypothetical protein
MKTKLIAIAVAATGLMSAATYAVEPSTQVVEYYHPILKHYFITASATDARLVDSGIAGVDWVRTGRSFGAWSSRDTAPGDAVMVHRFYSAGAISHFYTAKDDEIRLLKDLEAKERAEIAGTNKPLLGWGYEGEAFMAVLPKNGVCPSGTETISRTYNHGYETGEGGNHRYISDDGLKQSMEDRKWSTEGVALCAPKSSSGSSSGGSNNSSGVVAPGNYSGTVLFKFEQVGQPEVKVRAALTLNLAANGALSGTGAGCTFAGAAVSQSASDKPLLGGSITATGCTDTRFNGVYGRVEIEQFGAKAIDIRFKQGDNAREAEIEGVLNLGTATPTPNPTPNPTTPPSSSGITGSFAGMSTWVITERLSGQAERIVLNANQNLALQITSAGVVTGAGQGCTFGGTLVAGINNRFNGVVTANGCTDARLSGSYQAEVHPEDGGAIEAELEREVEAGGTRTKVTIKGNLSRSSTVTPPAPNPNPNPNPTPTPSGIAIAGNFSGSASFLATRRPSGGREVIEVNSTQALSIAISSAGDVTGTGAGCSFSGKLASSATPGIFSGTITASGCTDAIIRGSYAATASREDAGIELELERETETNGERVKVKVKGRLGKQ